MRHSFKLMIIILIIFIIFKGVVMSCHVLPGTLAALLLLAFNPVNAAASVQSAGSDELGGDAQTDLTLPAVKVTQARSALDAAPPAAPGGQVASAARMGLMGNVQVLETPFSVTSYTAQQIENTQAHSVADVLAADPSVRMATARSNINEDLNIRGFQVSSSDFALNGLFGLTPLWRAPLDMLERVEVIKGPSAALYGMSPGGSIGGVVNLVPKRAGEVPLARVTLSHQDDAVLGVHSDLGRRFGPGGMFGARVNLMHREGDTTLDAQWTRQHLGSLGLDMRHKGFRAALDVLWSREHIHNVVRQFSAGPDLTAIPRAPDNRTTYPGYGWTDGRDGTALVKLEYDLGLRWTLNAGYGRHKANWGALAANPVLLDTAGDYSYFGGWQKNHRDDTSWEAGVRGVFNTGAVSHQLAAGVTRFEREGLIGFYTGFPGGSSNLYNRQIQPPPSIAGIDNPMTPWQDIALHSIALADTLGLMDERILLSLGVRRQNIKTGDYPLGGGTGVRAGRSETTPFAGVVYKLHSNLSLYASYVEGLSRGETAPVNASIRNPGEQMPPYVSKQKELGLKFGNDALMAAFSVFELTRPSAGISGDVFGIFGQQRNRGVEASLAGEPASGVRLLGGITYTDGELSASPTPALRGNRAIGVARWQANLGSEWDVPFAPGLTLTTRWLHTGNMAVNAANTLHIPRWQRWDVGARYVTRLLEREISVRLNMENLTNRNYWGTATAGYLFIGSPRTLNLSLAVDF